MSFLDLFLVFLGIFVLVAGYRFVTHLLRFQQRHQKQEATDARLQARIANAGTSTDSPVPSPQTLAREQQVLQAMCASPADTGIRELGLVLLSDYSFQKTSHQMVFNALKEIPTGDPAKIRALLPAHLTRKGFPDLDCGPFLASTDFPREEIKEQMKSLAGLTNAE